MRKSQLAASLAAPILKETPLVFGHYSKRLVYRFSSLKTMNNSSVHSKEDISMPMKRLDNSIAPDTQEDDAVVLQGEQSEVAEQQFFKSRLDAMGQLKANGYPTYAHKFQVDMTIPEYVEMYTHIKDGEHLEHTTVGLAGRIMRVARGGGRLFFFNLHGDGKKVQVISSLSYFSGKEKDFYAWNDEIRRGDIVGISGFPGKSKKGELSIFARKILILAPCLHMLPALNGLKDQDIRYRRRYLDLMVNRESREPIIIRAKVIQEMRQFLTKSGFLEVETPMLNKIAGGAAARPFTTYHNELESNLYLRVAPELFLKMLVVGGIEKVFEIGKNFRNEGIDLTHNPEFTSCEFYWAYADYSDLMEFTEQLLSTIVMAIHGAYKVEYTPHGCTQEESILLDFEPPYRRVSLIEELERCSGESFPLPYDSIECIELMKSILKRENVELPRPPTAGKLIDQLCGHFIESQIVGKPTFIMDHPQVMSPLAKWHRSKPHLTERFELFIDGKEICNAYTELNDPVFQRKCFADQMQVRNDGDEEANEIDEEFCTALEYGLAPTAGWGLGIDRLTMFLSNRNNIKEVLCFPAMRSREQSSKKV